MASKEDRASAYSSSKNNGMDSMENLSAKLQADLRGHIQKLCMVPVLSPKWWDMSKSLRRIGSITAMEEKLEKKNEDATLWECEEVALRFLLEDGKLNLCLRLLVDVKKFQYAVKEHDTELEGADAEELESFEESVGQIMRNAWKHVEAVQTTDIPLLIEHVSTVLKMGLQYPKLVSGVPDARRFRRQETLVMYYFQDLLTQMTAEAIAEHRVMPEIRKRESTTLLITHLSTHHSFFRPEDNEVGSKALALIVDSEDYSGKKTDYIPKDARSEMISLGEKYLDKLVEDDREIRKNLRKLTDEIQKFKFSSGK